MATTYIVRLKDEDQLVAVLVVNSLHDLFWSIDEVTDPWSCEYKLLNGGGVCWSSANTGVVYEQHEIDSDEPDDDGKEKINLDGAKLTDYAYMQYEDNRKWKSFKYEDVEDFYGKNVGMLCAIMGHEPS
jgi:hypothetical protein